MRWLDDDAVAAGIAAVDVLAVIREAFRQRASGTTILPEEATLYWPSPDPTGYRRSIAMHAYLGGAQPRVGMKMINAATANPSVGLPRAEGIVVLLCPETAKITHIMPAAAISAARTAAVSVLALRARFGAAIKTLAVLGAGVQARTHLEMVARAGIEVGEVRVYDLDRVRATQLAEEATAGQQLGCTAEVAGSARAAVHGADAVIAVTTVNEPYVELDWLAPGSLVVNVSLDDLAPSVLLGAEQLWVDDWATVTHDRRRLLGRLAAEGLVTRWDDGSGSGGRVVTGELSDLLAGRPAVDRVGRVVVNPFGLAIGDVALASAIVDGVADRTPSVFAAH